MILIALVLPISFMVIICGRTIIDRPVNIAAGLKNEQALFPEQTYYFESLGLGNFTCTGLAYDSVDDAFWIADYGALSSDSEPSPRLIEISSQFSEVLKVIWIKDILDYQPNVQGIAYDEINDSIWIAEGERIVEMNKSGDILSAIDLGRHAKYRSNGVSMKTDDQTIWVLCYSKYLLNYDRNGKLLKELEVNYLDQDHIYFDGTCLYVSVGADYGSNNNFLIDINLETGTPKNVYRLEKSYALEGIWIGNGKLYVANDGKYHSASIGKSYINVYDFNTMSKS